MHRTRFVLVAGFALCAVLAVQARAAVTATFVQNTISQTAIAADPTGTLATSQSWSLWVDYTEGFWASAGVRLQLPAGMTFYNTAPARGGSDFRANPAFLPIFPDLEFDTYVSSARNQMGASPPSVLGGFPEDEPPPSFGGPDDARPGIFSVAWGDPMATSGPAAPQMIEIARFTFPASVPFSPALQVNNAGQFTAGQTSVVEPTQTIAIVIPEPSALGFLAAAGLLAVRRRKA